MSLEQAVGGHAEVLEIGSGLGGPARFLAATRGLRLVGIDLTPKYAEVAIDLTHRCGLADRARLLTANALGLPFDDARFAPAVANHAADLRSGAVAPTMVRAARR